MPKTTDFDCRGARSPALFATLLSVMALETVVLHLWLAANHPAVAWVLSVTSIVTMAWLVGDYRALQYARVRVGDDRLDLAIGWRVAASIPREQIASVSHASWRDIPDGAQQGFADVTKPAQPNIIIRCDPPASVRLLRTVNRRMSTIALCVDDPDALVMLMRPTADGVGSA